MGTSVQQNVTKKQYKRTGKIGIGTFRAPRNHGDQPVLLGSTTRDDNRTATVIVTVVVIYI
jgi:hypothetical protein